MRMLREKCLFLKSLLARLHIVAGLYPGAPEAALLQLNHSPCRKLLKHRHGACRVQGGDSAWGQGCPGSFKAALLHLRAYAPKVPKAQSNPNIGQGSPLIVTKCF